jgi:hypothetical protein
LHISKTPSPSFQRPLPRQPYTVTRFFFFYNYTRKPLLHILKTASRQSYTVTLFFFYNYTRKPLLHISKTASRQSYTVTLFFFFFFFFFFFLQLHSTTQMLTILTHTHPYKYMYANPTPMSTSRSGDSRSHPWRLVVDGRRCFSQYARTLTPVNTRTQTLPLGASLKD